MTTAIVSLGAYNGVDIHARPADGFIDVTELCQAHGREWPMFARLASTKAFIEVLETTLHKVKGSLIRTGGGYGNHTFAEERIALKCAAWISIKFEAWVYDRIRELLRTGSTSIAAPREKPAWSQRMNKTAAAFRLRLRREAPGWWAVLSETIADLLIIEDVLDRHGIPLAVSDLPDGSIGIRWARHREATGMAARTQARRDVALVLPAGGSRAFERPVFPLLYPDSEYAEFRRWMADEYTPVHLPEYVAEKAERDRERWASLGFRVAREAVGAAADELGHLLGVAAGSLPFGGLLAA